MRRRVYMNENKEKDNEEKDKVLAEFINAAGDLKVVGVLPLTLQSELDLLLTRIDKEILGCSDD